MVPMEKPENRAVRRAREAADETHRIIWTNHIKEQMLKRSITTEQVLTCLEKGRITEGPAPDIKGGWKFNLCCVAAGDEVEIVIVVNLDEDVVLITAI